MKGSSLNHLRLLFPMIANPRLCNKFQNSLRILQQLLPIIVDSKKFQNRLRILNSASSRLSTANMNVRKVSTDIVQDLPEKASTKARPASIISSNDQNGPKIQSPSALSAGQMEFCIHVRNCQNLTEAAADIMQAAIRRGTRAHRRNCAIVR